MARYDAVVVGAGPNGLAAAIVLAQAGQRVLVLEANDTVGGAARSAQITLPGFIHDLGSAVHPFCLGSPFLRTLPLAEYGLSWVHPDLPLAHPLDDGHAAVLDVSVQATAAALGPDGHAYLRLMVPIVRAWEQIVPVVTGPPRLPRHPFAAARFGLRAIWPAQVLGRFLFRGVPARSLFAGMAAHSCLPLERPPSAAVALVLAALGHTVGWPIPRGGAQRITAAMAAYLQDLGGEIRTGTPVRRLQQLPPARAMICDITPRQLLALAGDSLPPHYRAALTRYRYGPGVFKVDWALDAPIPWRAAACARAGTVHLGGTAEQIAAAERDPWHGAHSEQPYVLLSQPTLFDTSRAPAGAHTVWAYCHVPNGSSVDMTARIEAQIERFAPGFRSHILARHASSPADLEALDANLVGGDINGGAMILRQLFTRPAVRWAPYTTPLPGLYLCSSSTPPGGGVHGMCGYHAAQAVLRGARYA